MRSDNVLVGSKSINRLAKQVGNFILLAYNNKHILRIIIIIIVVLLSVSEFVNWTKIGVISAILIGVIEFTQISIDVSTERTIKEQAENINGLMSRLSANLRDTRLAIEKTKQNKNVNNDVEKIQKSLLIMIAESANMVTDTKYDSFCANLMVPMRKGRKKSLELVEFSEQGVEREKSELNLNIKDRNDTFGAVKAFYDKETQYITDTRKFNNYNGEFDGKKYTSILSFALLSGGKKNTEPVAVVNIDTPYANAFHKEEIENPLDAKTVSKISQIYDLIKPMLYLLSVTTSLYNYPVNEEEG